MLGRDRDKHAPGCALHAVDLGGTLGARRARCGHSEAARLHRSRSRRNVEPQKKREFSRSLEEPSADLHTDTVCTADLAWGCVQTQAGRRSAPKRCQCSGQDVVSMFTQRSAVAGCGPDRWVARSCAPSRSRAQVAMSIDCAVRAKVCRTCLNGLTRFENTVFSQLKAAVAQLLHAGS